MKTLETREVPGLSPPSTSGRHLTASNLIAPTTEITTSPSSLPDSLPTRTGDLPSQVDQKMADRLRFRNFLKILGRREKTNPKVIEATGAIFDLIRDGVFIADKKIPLHDKLATDLRCTKTHARDALEILIRVRVAEKRSGYSGCYVRNDTPNSPDSGRPVVATPDELIKPRPWGMSATTIFTKKPRTYTQLPMELPNKPSEYQQLPLARRPNLIQTIVDVIGHEIQGLDFDEKAPTARMLGERFHCSTATAWMALKDLRDNGWIKLNRDSKTYGGYRRTDKPAAEKTGTTLHTDDPAKPVTMHQPVQIFERKDTGSPPSLEALVRQLKARDPSRNVSDQTVRKKLLQLKNEGKLHPQLAHLVKEDSEHAPDALLPTER